MTPGTLLHVCIKPIRMCEEERTIHASKTARMRQSYVNHCWACHIWHIIQVTMRVGYLLVDCWWNDLLFQYQCCYNGFDCTGGSLRVADHRLCRADRNMISVLLKDSLICSCLRDLVVLCRTAM